MYSIAVQCRELAGGAALRGGRVTGECASPGMSGQSASRSRFQRVRNWKLRDIDIQY